MSQDLDTDKIKDWRSIVTLVVFVLTNLAALFPFHVPIYVPRTYWQFFLTLLSSWRVISPRKNVPDHDQKSNSAGQAKGFMRFRFPMNIVTAPLLADLFLLAILAIGKDEVYGGTIGADNIHPIDIMVFFITLAYIAISIDASGLIRWLAYKVLSLGGKVGHKLFFYLYVFFFALTSFIGNDPIILSGTAFLSYLTRVSSNIKHPRAWIHTQFAVANIGSAILVSSNPTNLVLAGAFNITFVKYSANMIVPVIATVVVLFPFLLYVVFRDPDLIPYKIELHDLPEELKGKTAINPNIPDGRGILEEESGGNFGSEEEQVSPHLLEEVLNPFLDTSGAIVGAVLMTITLVTVLALNAAAQEIGQHPVFYVTLPAAVLMLCWDIGYGWTHRAETRKIASEGRVEMQRARARRVADREGTASHAKDSTMRTKGRRRAPVNGDAPCSADSSYDETGMITFGENSSTTIELARVDTSPNNLTHITTSESRSVDGQERVDGVRSSNLQMDEKTIETSHDKNSENGEEFQLLVEQATLVSQARKFYRWSQETFPTATTVATHLPFALVPFAFCMFVLVQALVTKGWVPVFAYGWDHWVQKTGTIGAIGGMAFLSVILSNFAGTNIGTTILLCRVVQAWQQIRDQRNLPISNREFWGTVYSMAIGVNYGAFSIAFSASLAGLLWRDILARKYIRVGSLEFARVNLPIIAMSMMVGCAVLVGQVYVVRNDESYNGK